MTALLAPATTSKASKRLFAVLALLGAWAVLAISGATPALAHATVVGSDPAESSRLQAVPGKVTVTLSEDVTLGGGYLKVVDSKSNIVSDGTAKIDGRNVSVAMKSGLGDGSYIVSYRVTSADSHPIGGAYAFVVGDGPLVAATGSVVGGGTDGLISKIFDVARFVGFLGVVLLGGLVFVVLCWPAGRTDPRARRLIWYGWWAAVAGAVLGLILLGVLAVLAVRILREPQRTAERSRARDEDLAAICGLGVLATYGGVGHAAAGNAPTLALLADTSHLAAASVWIGGLIILAACLLPRRRTGELAEAMPRYSRVALGCVAVLAVTGTYQAWREVWPIPALWATSYGQLLLAKVIGFLLIVAVAYFSRQAVQRRYVRPVAHALSVKEDGTVGTVGTLTGPESGPLGEDRRMVRRLRTSVGIELALGIVVLAVAAVLVSQAPARTTYVKPVDKTVALASGGTAEVELTPAKVGQNTLTVKVFDKSGKQVDARAVTATEALPSDQYGPLEVPMQKTGTGQYSSSSVALSKTGNWELVVRVQMSEFDRDVVQVDVKVT